MIIEIRPLVEKAKVKQKSFAVQKAIGLRGIHKVPHVALIYDCKPKESIDTVTKITAKVAQKYSKLDFLYDGWELREAAHGYEFGYKIVPSKNLKLFREELYRELKPHIIEYGSSRAFNELPSERFWFHSAIAFRLHGNIIEKINGFVKDSEAGKNIGAFPIPPLILEAYATRISFVSSARRIIYEYDTVLDKVLTREEALSRTTFSETLKSYRKKEELEINNNVKHTKQKDTWLISDTHFGHKNIIGHCARPFANAYEMNEVLLNNWNNTISKSDKVYFLGDLSVSHSNEWKDKLNGDITFISGNHDPEGFGEQSKVITYNGIKFLLVHSPHDRGDFKGWVIHGHTHNNNLMDYPFINFKQKTINVSVELTKYRPIDFDSIIKLIKSPKKENILYY